MPSEFNQAVALAHGYPQPSNQKQKLLLGGETVLARVTIVVVVSEVRAALKGKSQLWLLAPFHNRSGLDKEALHILEKERMKEVSLDPLVLSTGSTMYKL